MRNCIASVVETISPRHEEDGRLVWKTITAPWETRVIFMVQTNPAALGSTSSKTETDESIYALGNIREYTEQTCADLLTTSSHMENILPILGEQYIDFPIASAPTGLFPGSPVAMQMMELSKIVEKRAIYEIIHLKNEAIDQILRQWVAILHTHAGLAGRVRQVGETIHWAKTKTEIRAVLTILFQAKRRQVQPGGPTYDGRDRRDLMVDAMRGRVMLMMGDEESLRPWLREVCIEEQDEGEFDAIMRMVYQGPASQGPGQGPAPGPASQGPASQGPPPQGNP